MALRVYTAKGFQGIYPTGTSAVIVAETREQALLLLNDELRKAKLPETSFADCEIEILLRSLPTVKILNDGDY